MIETPEWLFWPVLGLALIGASRVGIFLGTLFAKLQRWIES